MTPPLHKHFEWGLCCSVWSSSPGLKGFSCLSLPSAVTIGMHHCPSEAGLSISLLFFKKNDVCACVCMNTCTQHTLMLDVYMWVYMAWHACGGQRDTLWSWFSPSTFMWFLGI